MIDLNPEIKTKNKKPRWDGSLRNLSLMEQTEGNFRGIPLMVDGELQGKEAGETCLLEKSRKRKWRKEI